MAGWALEIGDRPGGVDTLDTWWQEGGYHGM